MTDNKFQIRFETLGCRLNQIESEGAARFFVDSGFTVDLKPVSAASPEDLSTLLCVINTCSVTQKAEQKARRIIRLILKKYPNSVVLVTGCYAQLRPEEIRELDKRVCTLGGQMKSRLCDLPQFIQSCLENGEFSDPEAIAEKIQKQLNSVPQNKLGVSENSFKLSTDSFLSHSRSSIKIQDGCNNMCSYCTINVARGKSVSLDAQTVIDRVVELEKKGQSEVVFTSVNIAQYRGEYEGRHIKFSELLQLVLDSTNKINIRISSIYPEIVDEEFCRAISSERVCPHFHISVQSGSNKILGLMKRSYEAKDVENACNMIKAVKENPFLACDIITGFPGETDEDFADTMKLMKTCGFAWVHAFPYSERPGTLAVTMKNKVPQSIAGERVKEITSWAVESKVKYIEKFLGNELEAVIENVRQPKVLSKDFVMYHAVTKNFIHCELKIPAKDAVFTNGNKISLKITEALKSRIIKGGEIEAAAEFVKKL